MDLVNSPVMRLAAMAVVEKIAAAAAQMESCVRPTAPMPMSFPASMSLGSTVESMTSKMRDVFS